MDRRWCIQEEWDIWVMSKDLKSDGEGRWTKEIHFPGPGCRMRYYFYVRYSEYNKIANMKVSIDEGELEKEFTELEIEAEKGFRWARIGKGWFNRKYRRITISGIKDPSSFDRLLITSNEIFLTDGRAEQRIEEYNQGDVVKSGVPLGGIGAGKIELGRDGAFHNITINGNIDTPFYDSLGSLVHLILMETLYPI